jgi:hypothetical protein
LPSRALFHRPDEDRYRPGIAKLGALKAVIADNNMIQIAMLKHYARFTNRYAFAAIGALLLNDDKGPVLAAVYGAFRANLHALAALGADLRLVKPRLRKMGFYPQAGLFGIDFVVMRDGADLCAETAAAAFPLRYFDSLDCHIAPIPMLIF